MPDAHTSNPGVTVEERAEGLRNDVTRPVAREAWDKANRFALRERFVYRGSVVALAGRFSRPEERIIPAQASACLPGGGGLAEAQVEDFKAGQLLSFSKASGRTEGRQSMGEAGEKRFTTTAAAVIEGLTIAGRLTADKLQVSLLSKHSQLAKHPSIVPVMPEEQSFRLDGHEIRVRFETELFSGISTWRQLRKAYREDAEFFEQNGHLFFDPKALKYRDGFFGRLSKKGCEKRRKLPSRRGYLLCTIVRHIESDHPQARVFGNIVELAGFGRIFLGEMIIDRDTRRLALLRFELDPAIGAKEEASADSSQPNLVSLVTNGGTKGDGEVGCVGTNGHCYP